MLFEIVWLTLVI